MYKAIKSGTDSLKEMITIYLVCATIAAILFSVLEHRNIFDSYWWTFVTGLSIGYGDIYPTTVAGKVLAVIWAHLALLFIIPMFVGRVIVTMIDNKNEFSDDEQRMMFDLIKQINGKIKR